MGSLWRIGCLLTWWLPAVLCLSWLEGGYISVSQPLVFVFPSLLVFSLRRTLVLELVLTLIQDDLFLRFLTCLHLQRPLAK